jgi:hypothetical protein
MYFCRSQSGPAIADPSAFVHHAMHRISAARSLIARLLPRRADGLHDSRAQRRHRRRGLGRLLGSSCRLPPLLQPAEADSQSVPAYASFLVPFMAPLIPVCLIETGTKSAGLSTGKYAHFSGPSGQVDSEASGFLAEAWKLTILLLRILGALSPIRTELQISRYFRLAGDHPQFEHQSGS